MSQMSCAPAIAKRSDAETSQQHDPALVKVSWWRWKHNTACFAPVKVNLSHWLARITAHERAEECTVSMRPGTQSYCLV